jgi:two-component system KDP operon response regulator KdpE
LLDELDTRAQRKHSYRGPIDRDNEAGKVQALDLGADDHITKPNGCAPDFRISSTPRRAADFSCWRPVVDLVRRIVNIGDSEVNWSPKKYELLRVLFNMPAES